MNEIITKDASGALQKIYTPPAGEVMLFAGDAVPDGWLPCAGALVSRSAYPELFAAVGEKYGAGDGSTTFALPDTADRFPRFAGTLDVGVTQEDAIRNIVGFVDFRPSNSSDNILANTCPPFAGMNGGGANIAGSGYTSVSVSKSTDRIAFDVSTSVPTADENRPKAIAFKACIKY